MCLKKLFSLFFCALFFLIHNTYSMEIKKQNKSIDETVYLPPTLQKICLLTIVKQKQDSETSALPEKLKKAAAALQKIHENEITIEDLKVAFHGCAHTELQKKVDSINERRAYNPEIMPIHYEKNHPVPTLPLFEGLAWMLQKYCKNNIDNGLIQISRFESWKKRKVHIAILLSLGANINHFGTVHGRIRSTTPLVTATIYKLPFIVEMLLRNKADVNQEDQDGYTPYALAKNFRNKTIATLLREYGAKDLPNTKNFENHPCSFIDCVAHIFNNKDDQPIEGFSCSLQ